MPYLTQYFRQSIMLAELLISQLQLTANTTISVAIHFILKMF